MRDDNKRDVSRCGPMEWFGTKIIKRIIYKCSNGYWLPHLITVTDPRLIVHINDMQNLGNGCNKDQNGEEDMVGEPNTKPGLKPGTEKIDEPSNLREKREESEKEGMEEYIQSEIESDDDEWDAIRSGTDKNNLNGFSSMYEYKTVTPFLGNIGCNISLERSCINCGNQIRGQENGSKKGKQYNHFNYFEGLCDVCATIMLKKYNGCDCFSESSGLDVCNIGKEYPIFKKCNHEYVILIGILGFNLELNAIRIIIMIVERNHAMDALRRFGAICYIMIDSYSKGYNCCNGFKEKYRILKNIFPEFNNLIGMTMPIYSYFKLDSRIEWRLEGKSEYYIDQFASEVLELLNFIEYGNVGIEKGRIANWDKVNWILGRLLGYLYLRKNKSGLVSEPNFDNIDINISSGCILEDYWIPNNIQELIQQLIQQTDWTIHEKKSLNGEVLGSIGPILFTQEEIVPFESILGGSIQ